MTETGKDNRIAFRLTEFQWRFLVFSAIIGLFVFPIIHADVLYADDYVREANGFVALGGSGRILAELLFYFFHLSWHISDTGAFFQIASIFILAAPIALFSLILNYNRLSAFLALPFIVCCPLFLQNLSYRYDSLTMSLSLALAIWAVCFQVKQKYLCTVLCLLGTFNFYQASFNSFLILSCLAALWCLFEKGERASIISLGEALGCGFLGLVLYKIQLFLFSLLPFSALKIKGYAASHSAVNYHVFHIFDNIILGLKNCFIDFIHAGIFISLSCGMILGMFVLLSRLFRNSKDKDFLYRSCFIFYGLMLILFSVICIIGPMAFLENMLVDPRVMVGLGAFVSLCISFLVGRQAVWKAWKRLPAALSAFVLFEVMLGAFVYATVLSEESEFDTKMVDQMLLDTYALTADKPVFIRYVNLQALSFSPKTCEARTLQPWINHVLENNYNMFWYWLAKEIWFERGAPASMHLERVWGEPNVFSEKEVQNIVSACNYDHFVKRHLYSIYQKGDKIAVDFSSSCPKEYSSRT